MSKTNGILTTLVEILLKAVGSGRASRTSGPRRPDARLRPSAQPSAPASPATDPGRVRGTETVRIDPDRIKGLQVAYAPQRDGAPDAGEIVWTWVPYEENDGRGKDRPVLVIGRESAERVYAVRMTSKPHEGERDYLSIGAGAWDSQGRESWIDVEQLYSVHERGLRREAAVLDRGRYDRVGAALTRRYGWSVAG
ncbi:MULTISPECIES: type II toxin-antitoxin system PemK/MazF family toxin [unclassified Microbacterium]|uniref:type II toxin-antitoxin system PemK/MazF family toxin n=1 Tax=unclassified Microbacterium TaxID=2609290 RepID=UPI000CFD7392|nr:MULTISPECIES: type II toxin-antitoxin system PemK/MazF family toxin [unclassified Microbacterium]PQZ60966.1 PemK domain-containing protein [Microbacterium sp. MYb43]PQZ82175.1 PemK domain-containing protein [Microbacterium sp. MYb40]PRB24123.1 PemK domain-containing protein [Microbacterium sp. MYb54]PRB30954.1 PemK domain-containing protein [Microbacterium sp. MYb50]PRB70623.1 PemK domain-containing protein [Microbacterium sp. MYb24]